MLSKSEPVHTNSLKSKLKSCKPKYTTPTALDLVRKADYPLNIVIDVITRNKQTFHVHGAFS